MTKAGAGTIKFFLSAAFLLVAALGEAAAQTLAPAEAYGRLPAVSDAAISPDGTKVALAVSAPDGGQAVRVIALADGATVWGARINAGGRETERSVLRGVSWADDRRVVYTISATISSTRALPVGYYAPGQSRLDYWRAGIADIQSSRQYLVRTTEDEGWGLGNLASLTAPIESDPGFGRLLAWTGAYSGDALGVYRVDLNTGRGSILRRGGADTIQFVLDRNGAPVARLDADQRSNRWRILDAAADPQRLIAEGVSEIGLPPAILGVLTDGRLGGVDHVTGSGRDVFFAMNRETGAIEVLFENETYDVDGVLEDPWLHEIVGVQITESLPRQHFLDPVLADALARLQAMMPNAIVNFQNWSRDRTKFLAYIEQPNDAGGYYVFTPAAAQPLARIAMRYPDLAPEHLGERQEINFRARDGVRVPTYVTYPPGVTERRGLPLVVLVHGGPAARDDFAFDWWSAFMASRGYVVVQPNYRGSGGYGQEWQRAGYRQWGALMQTDVEDSVGALVRAGIADPARVCIVGASYGGYAALAGASLTPDRYRCAVSIAGVSDLPMMLANVERRSGGENSFASDWWRMLIGDRGEDGASLRAVSPAYQAAAVRAPILLIHGANDTIVPIAQSRRMEDRLRAEGKDVRLVEFPGEDHWLSDAPTRIQMLQELDAFLAAHLRP